MASPVWHFLNGVPVIPTMQAGTVLAGDGSASAPSYSFASDTDTGFYWSGANGAVDFSANATARLRLSDGMQLRSASTLDWSSGAVGAASDVSLSRGALNRLDLASGDSFRLVSGELQFGSGSRVFLNGSVWTVDNGAGGTINSQFTGAIAPTTSYALGGGFTTVISATAPTIASGFGTSPSIVASNGTAAFTVNVGTGGTASSGVITMPAAANGWACQVENITAVAANRANQRTVQTATTTTSITVQNQTISTGAALAWTASDVLRVLAIAY